MGRTTDGIVSDGVRRAIDDQAIVVQSTDTLSTETIPVQFDGKVLAFVYKETGLLPRRSASELERAYLEAAADLGEMMAEGSFPVVFSGRELSQHPRVGDGLLKISPDGEILYTSPNAISLYRRLGISGNPVGQSLWGLELPNKGYRALLAKGIPFQQETEKQGTAFVERIIPLTPGGNIKQLLILVKDITELREQERLLRYKESAIREIHHRVKNNLQTVASLLRLQARRLESAEAKRALEESVNRIRSIALVHETLSFEDGEVVNFTKVAQELVPMITADILVADNNIDLIVEVDAGFVTSELATPMALAMTELIQNAAQHAFPNAHAVKGKVKVKIDRHRDVLEAEISDNGIGLPKDFQVEEGSNLGLRIVNTLIVEELGGEMTIGPTDAAALKQERGTCVRLRVPLVQANGRNRKTRG